MKAALIFYSKTGRTKRIALRLKDLLSNAGLNVDIYEIRHRKEYLNKLLHLNPRLIMVPFWISTLNS